MQILFNLLAMAGFAMFWLRLRLPPQDDPRMSRGLQLLQTKITVLEDLSDRTDTQVKQLTGILEQKTRVVQNKILEAEQQVLKIDHSMHRSLEVAEIFQDKIPHQEILERQRTVEYVKAARMAHSGLSIDEISQNVHLPREQVELIAKFNREQLMFDPAQLPKWATQPTATESEPEFALNNHSFVNGLEFQIQPTPLTPPPVRPPQPAPVPEMWGQELVPTIPPPPTVKKVKEAPPAEVFALNRNETILRNGASAVVKKVIFPRIEK